jgi:hypothetical protein
VGGLFLDVFIAWLIKLAIQLRRGWGSSKWERVKAKVDSSALTGGWVMNCPTAEVAYTYDFGGQTYSAIDSSPFLSKTLAEEQVEHFQPGEIAIVRVNQTEPQRSVLRRSDQ